MNKSILNGFGNVFGWALGIAFLWFMTWITGRMVEWSYYHTWVSYTVVIALWMSLYGWWYCNHKKREAYRNEYLLTKLIDDIRDTHPEVNDYLELVHGIERR